MANLYRKYMRLLDKWPIDKSKSQDFGRHLRDQIKIAFVKGESTKLEDKKKCEEYLESLERISSDYYNKKYPHEFTKTSTGLTLEQSKAALTEEFVEYVTSQNVPWYTKLKQKITGTQSDEPNIKEEGEEKVKKV